MKRVIIIKKITFYLVTFLTEFLLPKFQFIMRLLRKLIKNIEIISMGCYEVKWHFNIKNIQSIFARVAAP